MWQPGCRSRAAAGSGGAAADPIDRWAAAAVIHLVQSPTPLVHGRRLRRRMWWRPPLARTIRAGFACLITNRKSVRWLLSHKRFEG